jgi:hypothetical protein
MGKNVHNNVLDAALDHLKSNGTMLIVLNAEPTGASAYTNATTKAESSGYKLADASINSTNFTGPSDGDTSGRKVQVNAINSISIDGISSGSDSATHVCIVNDSASAVLYTTTCTSQSLTAGNKVNTPAWDIEIYDPA